MHVLSISRGLTSRLWRLQLDSLSGWPRHLKLALEVLTKDCALPRQNSFQLTIGSVAAAHACACAINDRSVSMAQNKACTELHNALKRVAKCSRRAPAALRNRLDEAIRPLIRVSHLDSEVIEELLETTAGEFQRFPNSEAAKTALGALSVRIDGEHRRIGAKIDYSALNSSSHREVELALANLGKTSTHASASQIFETMASALANGAAGTKRIDDIIVNYVHQVALLWRAAGLRPARASHPQDPNHKSKFHRFVDLVLTAIVEPSSRRHDDDLRQIAQTTWRAHAQLPEELRSQIGRTLRRSDVEWLVSDDHLKKALGKAVKKNQSKNHKHRIVRSSQPR